MGFWILLFLLGTVVSAQDLKERYVNSYVDPDEPNAAYQKPSPGSLEAAQQLFEQILRNRTISSEAEWSDLGFSIQKVLHQDAEFAVISENSATRGRGQGFYIIKLTPCRLSRASCNVVMQAIHRGTEYNVPEVSFSMFLEQDLFTAAAWNTLPRSKADLGKEPDSFYNAFTRSVASSVETPVIIQLHGFNKQKHNTTADLILSSTRKNESSSSREGIYRSVASKLRAELQGFPVFRYPLEIRELGGTLNINAKFFYTIDPTGFFFHTETSLPLRQALAESAHLRNGFSASFVGIDQAAKSAIA